MLANAVGFAWQRRRPSHEMGSCVDRLRVLFDRVNGKFACDTAVSIAGARPYSLHVDNHMDCGRGGAVRGTRGPHRPGCEDRERARHATLANTYANQQLGGAYSMGKFSNRRLLPI